MHKPTFAFIASCAFAVIPIGAVAASEPTVPLRQVVDEQIARGWELRKVEPSGPAADHEFLRRIYLDLIGRIPTVAEAQQFLDDPSANKRTELIDRLLDSPEYARHMQQVYSVVLMERRNDRHVTAAEWEAYLFESFSQNKPWDRLVSELLAADGTDANMRPAAKFYLDREADPHAIVRDIGRLFLGVNLQCAQCHDHPIVGDYLQKQYYGLFAFLNRSYLFTDAKEKKAYLAEKAEGDVTFSSVFEPDAGKQTTGPWLTGLEPLAEPVFAKGEEYLVAPAKDVRPVPKYSRREQLARTLPTASTAGFSKNIVNRLWAQMMGRGLVHPLEAHHSDNPPSHPELLDALAKHFEQTGYDIKAFLRELALSRTYQLSSIRPEGSSEDPIPEDSFAFAHLKPLWAEELGWSMMTAVGLLDAEMKAIEGAAKKKDPKFGAVLAQNPKWREKYLYERLRGNVAPFVRTYGSTAGQPEGEFQASLDQALFLANSGTIVNWLSPRNGNLIDRLVKTDDAQVAQQLYLAVFTRPPTAEEEQLVAAHLKESQDRTKALQELAWALVASAEFRFNH